MMMEMKEQGIPVSARQEQEELPYHLLLYLYIGHFLARWGARLWEFSVALYMINIWPESLLLAAAYGVVESASTALFAPFIGQLVDKLSYVQVLKIWILTQNFSFMVAGSAVIAILVHPNLTSSNFVAFIILVILINISAAVAVLSTLAGTILVEREWIVVISEGQPTGVLTAMNSTIRRIDLICNLFAPVVAGFIVSFVSLTASAVTLVLFNIISVRLQYWLLMAVHNGIPALRENSEKKAIRSSAREVGENTSTEQELKGLVSSNIEDLEQPETTSKSNAEKFLDLPYITAWKMYIRQDIVLPGIALALLYFTVLSFGTLMTATLEWEGIPAYVIGVARGISAIVGIAATFVYPLLEARISTLRTGLWSIWSQWTCLLLCVASVLVKAKLVSAYMLMSGVAASRLGLWMFDLSVIQQMQDNVAETDRCIVGGVQNSLQSFLELMTYTMGILISNPKEFWKLIAISFFLVTLAATLYSIHIYRVRKHLIHLDKLIAFIQRSVSSSSRTFCVNYMRLLGN